MWKITTVTHLTVIIKVNKNENLSSPCSCTHFSSPANALTLSSIAHTLTYSSPSNALFASSPHLFLSSMTPCSTPLLRATDLSHSPHRHHYELSPSALAARRCSHRVASLIRTSKQLPRSATNPSRWQHLHTLPERLHASSTSQTSFSPHHRAGHLATHEDYVAPTTPLYKVN